MHSIASGMALFKATITSGSPVGAMPTRRLPWRTASRAASATRVAQRGPASRWTAMVL